ncbi:MAG: ferredoxin [Planctomycetia bacterium]|nr:ferredoxin [Planctomycetia bacterium]
MATVYVSYTPKNDEKQPEGLIQATIGKETVALLPVEIGNEKLNCIQAAQKVGTQIPHYCWHPALTVVASCRMCLVEVGERKPDGAVVMQPRVVPGCQTPVKDGTVIVTTTAKVHGAQQQTLEGILLNHPLDCPVCDKAGECMLQDYTYGYGRATSRMIEQKNTPANKPNLGPNVSLFTDRCIMCSRCVRFTREVAGTAELQIINRGNHAEINVFPGEALDNKLASNVVDLCPVGALCSNDFLYKHRVWNLKTVDSVCPDCSTGCSIHLDGNKNIVYRLRPRDNPKAQGHFMCDEGRLGYGYVNSKDRILKPTRLGKAILWKDATKDIRETFELAAKKDGSTVAMMVSPWMTSEEALLLAKWARTLSRDVRLALGPVPTVGKDDHYPKDRRGNDLNSAPKFTIRAEKCPNKKGVSEVLKQFQLRLHTFEDLLSWVDAGQLQAVYLAAGYPPRGQGWITTEQADKFKKVQTVVVHDLATSPVSDIATWVLPAAAFAEKEGTFVNHAGLAQAVRWGVTPSGDCRTDGQVFLDLLQRRGLAHVGTLRKELAKEVRYFAPLAEGELGEYGIHLETPQGA